MPQVRIDVTTMAESGDFAAPTLTRNVGIIRTERIRLELHLTSSTLALVAGRAERRTKLVGRPRARGGAPGFCLELTEGAQILVFAARSIAGPSCAMAALA